MSPKQKKLAGKAPPPNKIDAKDFAVLKAEKAKGRGMGLQDESVQPGKVMKARMGKDVSYKNYLKGLKKATSEVKASRADFLANLYKKGPKGYSSMAEMRKAKGFKPGESASEFNKRRMALAAAKKAASATRIGKIALGVGAAGVAAQQYLKSKMNKKDEPKKKMGGGMMMQRPMGYNTGGGTSGDAPDTTKLRKTLKGAKDFYSAYKRDEQKVKKMGGGMMKKYSKGGGLDMGGPKGRLMAYAKENMIKDTDRLTLRDKAMIKTVKNMDKAAYPAYERYLKKLTSSKKMGGGMMQRPMGYKSGTMVKARGCKLGRTRPTKIT